MRWWSLSFLCLVGQIKEQKEILEQIMASLNEADAGLVNAQTAFLRDMTVRLELVRVELTRKAKAMEEVCQAGVIGCCSCNFYYIWLLLFFVSRWGHSRCDHT